MVIIGSGYSYLRQFAGYIAAGLVKNKMVDICGFGRMAIANPNFPRQIFENGIIDKNQVCITCSQCSGLMRQGKNTGCVIRDPQYKQEV
jgi:2,4-dienoyl-CoA reductase-like NADH-dependent reductase (Old Yellow Enzyme family)